MKNDIESQLSVYASAFDEFVDTGKYPVHDEEDVLMAYLVTVFEDCLGTQWWSDEILRDLLKNSVLEFFSILLLFSADRTEKGNRTAIYVCNIECSGHREEGRVMGEGFGLSEGTVFSV